MGQQISKIQSSMAKLITETGWYNFPSKSVIRAWFSQDKVLGSSTQNKRSNQTSPTFELRINTTSPLTRPSSSITSVIEELESAPSVGMRTYVAGDFSALLGFDLYNAAIEYVLRVNEELEIQLYNGTAHIEHQNSNQGLETTINDYYLHCESCKNRRFLCESRLKEAVINEVSYLTTAETVALEAEGERCPICLSAYENLIYVPDLWVTHGPVRTKCGHVFGGKCLWEWFFHNENNSCPLDRLGLTSDIEFLDSDEEEEDEGYEDEDDESHDDNDDDDEDEHEDENEEDDEDGEII